MTAPRSEALLGTRPIWLRLAASAVICVGLDFGHITSAKADGAERSNCAKVPLIGEHWSDQEKWVWSELCNNGVADLMSWALSQAPKGTSRAPGQPYWSEESILSPAFLRALLETPLNETLNQNGIVIRGARFGPNATLDLSFVRFDQRIFLKETLFQGDVRLTDTVFGDSLSLTKSVVEGDLDIAGAKIARDLWLEGVTVQGRTRLHDVVVGRNLYLWHGASLGVADLIGAHIKGNLRLSGSTFRDQLDMTNIKVDRHLFARRYQSRQQLRITKFRSNVFLRNALIGGRIEFIGVQVRGLLNMDAIRVKEDIFLRDCARFDDNIKLVFARIGQNLDLSGSQLRGIDATGARITGELRLGSLNHPKPNWAPDAGLNLRNAHVFSWQYGEGQEINARLFKTDCKVQKGFDGPWPQRIELNGFEYQQLGGLGGGGASDILRGKQAEDLVKGWLRRDKSYSPQPYEQLAKVLSSSGYKDMAKGVLYASKEQERSKAWGGDWLWLTTLKLVMGYGYRYSNALYWVVGLVGLGMLVLRVTHEGRRHKMPFGLFYSLDLLLPIVRLRDYHHQIQLRGVARYYFYFHKLVGYFLASVLIAGFSGLTK